MLSSAPASFRDIAARLFDAKEANPWTQFLDRLLEAWATESGDAELPVQSALEFLYEACAESRREFTYGEGVTLSTVHSAKGTEFDHVLVIGPWQLPAQTSEAGGGAANLLCRHHPRPEDAGGI